MQVCVIPQNCPKCAYAFQGNVTDTLILQTSTFFSFFFFTYDDMKSFKASVEQSADPVKRPKAWMHCVTGVALKDAGAYGPSKGAGC